MEKDAKQRDSCTEAQEIHTRYRHSFHLLRLELRETTSVSLSAGPSII
jgi:ribosomal protein S14